MSVISTQIQQWHALPSAQAKSEVTWRSLAQFGWRSLDQLTLTFLYPGLWFRASKQHMQEKMPSRNARTGTLIKHMPMHSLLAEKAESVFSKISTLLLGLHSQLAGTWDHNTAIFCHFYCSIKDVFFINFNTHFPLVFPLVVMQLPAGGFKQTLFPACLGCCWWEFLAQCIADVWLLQNVSIPRCVASPLISDDSAGL